MDGWHVQYLQEEGNIMALTINSNISAMNSYRNLSTTQNSLSSSLEKLSSGLRINKAADDAAGLAISEGLRAQVNGTKQAVRNAQDGISVVQTAEGALTETHSILQRMRTLSVQAANDGGLSAEAKGNIQDEMTQLTQELDRIASTTNFNGRALLDGDYDYSFQVGANVSASDKIDVKIAKMDSKSLGVNALNVNTAGTKGVDASWASTAALSDLAAGAKDSTAVTVKIDGSDYTIRDAGDGTNPTSAMTASEIASAINSAGATDGVSATLDADGKLQIAKTGVAGELSVAFTGISVAGAKADEGVLAKNSGAEDAIEAIDNAIKMVSDQRSELGAVQNRFDHTINNLNVASENLSASESRIRDTDMAEEMVEFTRSQILSQAGVSMLAQANSLPQSVLQLLQ
jgi:flagellin